MGLSKQHRLQLNELFLQLFNASELAHLVRLHLDEDLSAIVRRDANLTDTVWELVSWMERRGRVLELVEAALAARPNRTELVALRREIDLSGEFIGEDTGAQQRDLQTDRPAPGSVVVDIDDSTIQGSTFSINIGGGGHTSDDAPSPTHIPSSSDVRRQALRERLELLLEKLNAANRQYDQTLSAVDRVTLKRVIEQLEEESAEVERAILALDASS